jgi:tetratricopeptide (TPR) repeat protein
VKRGAVLVLVAALLAGAQAPRANADEATEALRSGAELHRRGDLEGALAAFERVVALAPESSFAWYNRGLVRRELKDCSGAVEDFGRAIALRAGFFNALYHRGNCLQALGDYAAAVEDYTRAVSLPGRIPARFLAYYARGDAWRRLARLEEAYADYTRVAELRTDTAALRARAWVSFYAGRWGDAYADARKHLHGTEGKEPDAPYTLAIAILALRHARKGDEVSSLLETWKALSSEAWPGPVLRYLAGEAVERELLEAATTPGRRTEALAYLGASLLADGDVARGVAALRKVLQEGEPAYLEYDLAYHELRRRGLAAPWDRRQR